MSLLKNIVYKINKRSYLFAFCILHFAFSGYAQNVVVTATLDTNNILIGDQINLLVKAQGSVGSKIKFPLFADTLSNKVEIVKQSKIDTNYSPDKQRYELSKRITITSFDSGNYIIPPFTFYLNEDTLHPIQTQTTFLKVQTMVVDTTKAFRDIKPPLNAPLTFDEILPYLIGLVVISFLIVALIIYLKKRKKNVVPILQVPEIIIPAHIEALEKLQQLKDEKLWQNGFEKEYHIRVSDIIRCYIEKRFGLTAMEQTTDEIMRHTRSIDVIDESLRNKLKQILALSDMVKFAKELPLPNENESSMDNALAFVHHTTVTSNNINDNTPLDEI